MDESHLYLLYRELQAWMLERKSKDEKSSLSERSNDLSDQSAG